MRGEQIISRLGQSILSHLVPFTNAQVGAFYLVTEEKKLQMVSGYALPKTEGPERLISFGEGLLGQVALEKRTLLIEDVPAGYFGKIGSALGEMVPSSLLICPILYENEVIGMVELGSLHTFTEHQRAFLSHVSENIGIAINTSDVRKKVQKQNEALNKAQVLLEEKAHEVQRASRYKTEFLANMSHELRTPLNSSLILAKLLMDNTKQNLTTEQTQYATSIYSSSKDLLNLINDILDLSKVEAGKLDIRGEKIDFKDVMNGLQQTFNPQAQEKELLFEVEASTGLPEGFITDRQRLDQILKNLISNALKFTSTGQVKVRLYPAAKGQVAFEVSDSGIGIPKEQQAIIFEAFRQADGTTNRKYGGTGLGLSISKDLARLLGGSIEVESTPGKGSRFTLVLPSVFAAVAPDVGAEGNAQEYHSKATGPKSAIGSSRPLTPYKPLPFEDDRAALGVDDQTFLVIEDDVTYAKILFDLAHELDFKCLIAQGAEEGVDLATEYNPNAIFLDVRLPDHIGLTVLDQLKKTAKTRHIPVAVMSAEDQFKQVSLQMGAFGFMPKSTKRDDIKVVFKNLEAKFTQSSHRVLLVEADEVVARNISRIIGDDETETIVVGNAKEATLALRESKFDCIVIDVKPPDFSGVRLLELLSREQAEFLPPTVVYVDGVSSEDLKTRLALVARFVPIQKVGAPENLFDQVSHILHRTEAKMSAAQKRCSKRFVSAIRDSKAEKSFWSTTIFETSSRSPSALEERGATIYVGRNGQEALDQLDLAPDIDLVLMDIMMPEMDGFEATRQIRKQKRFAKLPIIAVTAQVLAEDQLKCLEAGTNDYLSKPVDLEKLQSLIRVWISQ